MKARRPFTAPRQPRITPHTTISGYKRPSSAQTQSLKQIIQVIENTLNQGTQSLLTTKTKTLDKFSKLKQSEIHRKPKERKENIRDWPRFKTEFIIGSAS
jgi:hypothetical protein